MEDERTEYEKLTRKKEDVEIEEINSENEDYESSPPEYQITTYPADFTLEVLYSKWKAGDIEIPKFQRQFVWKQVQSSKLIESYLVGLPVPAIFLYTSRKSSKFLVIDGQQRLKSIFYFFDGYFGDNVTGKKKIFRLRGLNEKSKWKDRTFEDFDENEKRKLKDCILRAFVVQQLDPDDDTSIYHIFERLNTGGTLLTNQEVRNCIYGGKLNDLLIDLNEYPSWRSILGKPTLDSRQKDIELIVRFFALRNIEEYKKPLKDFLSKFMRHNRNPSSERLEELSRTFKLTCDTVFSKLGVKPFHVRKGLNSSVYDSVMVTFSKHLDHIPNNIKERYNSLVGYDNENFYKCTIRATTDEETVRKRFSLAEEILFKE